MIEIKDKIDLGDSPVDPRLDLPRLLVNLFKGETLATSKPMDVLARPLKIKT